MLFLYTLNILVLSNEKFCAERTNKSRKFEYIRESPTHDICHLRTFIYIRFRSSLLFRTDSSIITFCIGFGGVRNFSFNFTEISMFSATPCKAVNRCQLFTGVVPGLGYNILITYL